MQSGSSSSALGAWLWLLTVVLVVLKVFGFVQWSWVIVLAPLWIPTVLAVSIIGGIFITILVQAVIDWLIIRFG